MSYLIATPDAVMCVAQRVNLEWGPHGYHITGIRTESGNVTVASVRHFDGSEFEVAVDRYGAAVEWPLAAVTAGKKPS